MGLLWLAKPLKLTRGLSYLGDLKSSSYGLSSYDWIPKLPQQ